MAIKSYGAMLARPLQESGRFADRIIRDEREPYTASEGQAVPIAPYGALLTKASMLRRETFEETKRYFLAKWIKATTPVAPRVYTDGKANTSRTAAYYRIVPKLTHAHPHVRTLSGEGSTPPAPGDSGPMQSMTVNGGTEPEIDVDDTIDLGPDYNALMVYMGNFAYDTAHVSLYVNVNGVIKQALVFRDGCWIIRAAFDAKICAQAQKRTGSSDTETDVSLGALTVQPFLEPESIVAPSGTSGTVNCDKNGPPHYAPTFGHVTFAADNSCFQVQSAATYRSIHICEIDADDNVSPSRWVPIHPNTAPIIRVRNRVVAIATYDGSTIAINAPAGSTIGGTSVAYAPDTSIYTGGTKTVTASDDGFGADAGTLADNLAACLKNGALPDFSIIDVAAGTISWTTTNVLNATNYSAALGKSLWIRCTTGTLTFDASTWSLPPAVGKRWHISGSAAGRVVFDMGVGETIVPTASGSSILEMTGVVSLHYVEVRGLTNSSPDNSNDADVKITASGGNHITTEFSFCVFGLAMGDSIQTFGTTANVVLTTFGCTFLGNGPDAQHQVLTSHNSAANIIYDFGSVVKDDDATANVTKIAADSAGAIYLFYTVSLSAHIAHATEGVILKGVRGTFGVYFEKCSRITPRSGYLTGSTFIQLSAADIFMNVVENLSTGEWTGTCILHGSRFKAASNISGNYAVRCQQNVTAIGCEFEAQHATNGLGFRGDDNPATAKVCAFYSCRFTCAAGNAVGFSIGSGANLTIEWHNSIFEVDSDWSISASGASCTAQGNFFRRNPATAHTNFAAKFPGATGNDWVNGAAALGADGTPTVTSGATGCDNEGTKLALYGGMDRYGRPLWYGTGTSVGYIRGPVARAEIITDALFFPTVSL